MARAIPARAEMWPAATGQHRRCERRGERGRGRRPAATAGGRGGEWGCVDGDRGSGWRWPEASTAAGAVGGVGGQGSGRRRRSGRRRAEREERKGERA
jgi:hypothetical protein